MVKKSAVFNGYEYKFGEVPTKYVYKTNKNNVPYYMCFAYSVRKYEVVVVEKIGKRYFQTNDNLSYDAESYVEQYEVYDLDGNRLNAENVFKAIDPDLINGL
jgi:hypothetical protein